MSWTPFLQAFSVTDSIEYPIYGIDAEGTRIVTISRGEQLYLTKSVIELEKCSKDNSNLDTLVSLLSSQIKDCKAVVDNQDNKDSIQTSIIILNKDKRIDNLYRQIDEHKGISLALTIEKARYKKKILGWKIGTFTVLGVFAIALPTTIALLSK